MDNEMNNITREQDHDKSASDLSPFEKLRLDLHRMIFEKLDYQSFFRLKQCSKRMKYNCEGSGHLPTVYFEIMEFDRLNGKGWLYARIHDRIYSRIHAHRRLTNIPENCCKIHIDRLYVGKFNDEKEEAISIPAADQDAFRSRNVSVTGLFMLNPPAWSATEFNQFLDEFRVQLVKMMGPFNFPNLDSFMGQPAVRWLSSLQLDRVNGSISSENILALRAPDIQHTRVEATTLNSLLKQWQKGERLRRIVYLDVVIPDSERGWLSTREKCLIDLDCVTERSTLVKMSRASDHLTLSVKFLGFNNKRFSCFLHCAELLDWND